MFSDNFEHFDTAIKALGPEPCLKLLPETYNSFGQLFKRIEEIKGEHTADPVVLGEDNKILRETVTSMGVLHALEQGANGVSDFDTEIPLTIFQRASALVSYHKAVALRGRPPKAASLKSFNLKMDDTPESVRLRKITMAMRGLEISGTDLKRCGALDGFEPAAWRAGPGARLAEFGLITINPRSYGFSITRKQVPSAETDETAHSHFNSILSTKLNMTLSEYMETFADAQPRLPRARGGPTPSPEPSGVGPCAAVQMQAVHRRNPPAESSRNRRPIHPRSGSCPAMTSRRHQFPLSCPRRKKKHEVQDSLS